MPISPWRPADREAVIDLILDIQTREFGVAITRADQPDLEDVDGFYGGGGGGFWCARDDDRVIGTIALKDIDEGNGVLRKMFVAADRRGSQHGVAQALLDHLVAHARAQGLTAILLGTTSAFLAAHRFYEKNGFGKINPLGLPSNFPRMAQDDRFYLLRLDT